MQLCRRILIGVGERKRATAGTEARATARMGTSGANPHTYIHNLTRKFRRHAPISLVKTSNASCISPYFEHIPTATARALGTKILKSGLRCFLFSSLQYGEPISCTLPVPPLFLDTCTYLAPESSFCPLCAHGRRQQLALLQENTPLLVGYRGISTHPCLASAARFCHMSSFRHIPRVKYWPPAPLWGEWGGGHNETDCGEG